MNKNIVVVEDFGVSRKIIANVLTKAGHSVFEAEDGQEALKWFDGRQVDLLVTDYNMPNMDGVELIKKIRSNQKYSFIPILLLTTEVKEEKIKAAMEENITAWIKKPFHTTEFLNIISKALR